MSLHTIKTKCQRFFSTVIRLAGDTSTKTASNVKNLTQNLIDGVIEPGEFLTQLQKELQSNLQPYLIHFLKIGTLEPILATTTGGIVSSAGGNSALAAELSQPLSGNTTLTQRLISMSESQLDTTANNEEMSNGGTSPVEGTGSAVPVEGTCNEDETANLCPISAGPRRKRTASDDSLAAVTSALQNLGSRQGQLTLNTSIGHVVTATLESLNAEEQRQCISEIFSLLSKYTAS